MKTWKITIVVEDGYIDADTGYPSTLEEFKVFIEEDLDFVNNNLHILKLEVEEVE